MPDLWPLNIILNGAFFSVLGGNTLFKWGNWTHIRAPNFIKREPCHVRNKSKLVALS
jgi:hypothetical protein